MKFKALMGGLIFLGVGIYAAFRGTGSNWFIWGLIIIGVLLFGYGIGGKAI